MCIRLYYVIDRCLNKYNMIQSNGHDNLRVQSFPLHHPLKSLGAEPSLGRTCAAVAHIRCKGSMLSGLHDAPRLHTLVHDLIISCWVQILPLHQCWSGCMTRWHQTTWPWTPEPMWRVPPHVSQQSQMRSASAPPKLWQGFPGTESLRERGDGADKFCWTEDGHHWHIGLAPITAPKFFQKQYANKTKWWPRKTLYIYIYTIVLR